MRILVPRLFDADQFNAQNLNAKALLSRFRRWDCTWLCPHIGLPDAAVAANDRVKLIQLLPRRLWSWHLALLYQVPIDGIFYPGIEAHDAAALSFREITGRHVPTVATLEGLAGDEAREAELSRLAGHQVYCQRADARRVERATRVLRKADHIIAISPFLQKIGTHSYGDKCSMLPLGVDVSVFQSGRSDHVRRPRVLSAGNVRAHKRPEKILDLAGLFPEANFSWFGEGELRDPLIAEAERRGLQNVWFPGPLLPDQLAAEMAKSDIFVLTSHGEGVPKVTQEAASTGLPQIVFGFYEAPTVIDGRNGFVVWSDQQFHERLRQLLGDTEMRRRMGRAGAEMAQDWSWDIVAPRWEERIINLIEQSGSQAGKGSAAAWSR